MKGKTIKAILLLFAIITISPAASAQNIKKFLGDWDFAAPTAGYGYDTGVMVIRQDSVITSFTGNNFIYPSDFVKFQSDTLKFNFYVDDEYCKCYLILEDDLHQKGYCKWPSGESEVILTSKKIQE